MSWKEEARPVEPNVEKPSGEKPGGEKPAGGDKPASETKE